MKQPTFVPAPARRYACSLLLLLGLPWGFLAAQTRLGAGDLAIISVNANNSLCSGIATDRVSFVCFKDIEPGTVLDITDNGWERLNAGRWGNSEGFIRTTRTGPTIPAGTVITFEFPPIGNNTYQAVAPDNAWSFAELGINSVNLNSGGDQFYFMQGGTWNLGTARVGSFGHDATYTGGRILFGFNTKTTWNQLDNPQDSKLHPEVASCYHMEPTTGTTDFIAYTGPSTATNQLEWIIRISNAANWTRFSGCANLPAVPASVGLTPSGIRINCTTCTSCGPFNEVLRFQLPAAGGPFIVEYSDGRDTFRLRAAQNGDTVQVRAQDTATAYRLVSVTDSRNCPVYSEFDGGATLRVTGSVTARTPAPIARCAASSMGSAPLDLSAWNDTIRARPGWKVLYFRDQAATQPILTPASYPIGTTTLYAISTNDTCRTAPVPVVVQVRAAPQITATTSPVYCADCQFIRVQLIGQPPFRYFYTLTNANNLQTTATRTSTSAIDSFEVCLPFWGPGTNSIVFNRLLDSSQCDAAPALTLRATGATQPTRTLQRVLCPGEKLLINGITYDENRLTGSQVLPSRTPTGCDTLLTVQISYQAPANASWRTRDTALCGSGRLNLALNLPPGGPFTIRYSAGRDTFTQGNLFNGQAINVNPTTTTIYTLLSATTGSAGFCPTTLNSTVQVRVGSLRVTARPSVRFGAYEVSCPNARDGAAEVQVSAGRPPYQYRWNTGATTPTLRNLGPGNYAVTVTDSLGCAITSTLSLLAPDSMRLSYLVDTSVCPGKERFLTLQRISGGVPPYGLALGEAPERPVDRFPFRLPITSAANQFTLTDGNGCQVQQPLRLAAQAELNLELGPDRVVVAGDSVVLKPLNLNFQPVSVSWSPREGLAGADSLAVVARPTVTTFYTLTLRSAQGCTLTDRLQIRVQKKTRIYIPSAFAPNSGGENQLFTVFPGPEVQEIATLRVFDRWGNLIYQGANIGEGSGWDGMVGGEMAPAGAYVYLVEAQMKDGRKEVLKGSVTLVR